MESDEFVRVSAAEGEHWWYRSTRTLLRELLGAYLDTGGTVLDLGCGTGGNLEWLTAHGAVIGVDLSPDALSIARRHAPGPRLARATAEALPFGPHTFDVVVGVTVLYAVRRDSVALEEIARVLRPGGVLVSVEPAFPALARSHDAVVHGVRRYRRRELAERLVDAGLEPERLSYAYSFLAAPAAALALRHRLSARSVSDARSDVERRWLDPLLGPLARIEARWLRRHDLPVGTSVIAVATAADGINRDRRSGAPRRGGAQSQPQAG